MSTNGKGDSSGEPEASRKEYMAIQQDSYEKDIELLNSQDSRAEKMITMSSAIATLLIGIGTFLVSRIDPTNWLYNVDIFILMIGVVLAGVSIASCAYAIKIRKKFYHPFGPSDDFFPSVMKCEGLFSRLISWGRKDKLAEDEKREKDLTPGKQGKEEIRKICEKDLTPGKIRDYLDVGKLKKYWEMPKNDFAEQVIIQYIITLKLNYRLIHTRANYISIGQYFFLASVLSVSLVLLVTVGGIASGISFIEQVKSTKNELPISNAGYDKVILENRTVVLDGSESRDPDGTINSYLWEQTSGYRVNILNNSDRSTSFTAPNVVNATIFGFKLTVKDNKNGTSNDSVMVIVKNDTLQDPSHPADCGGVVPYAMSERINLKYFRLVTEDDTECSFPPPSEYPRGLQIIPDPFVKVADG